MSDTNCIPMPNKNFKTGLSDFVPIDRVQKFDPNLIPSTYRTF